ncbi:intraflagellar transport protein 43 homolog [Phymastichus coffea]|uniref:intraflagellar transport protein 43 homolog n=1 Tax=Phymastichus coffea TaxID=108790 RepID=UPI00273CD8AC|nr:intraflagellar transport protein 43 homolog [Phymastichus coffea]
MDWSTSDFDVTGKKLIPRLGRRANQSSVQEEKSDDDLLDSPDSLSSGKLLAKTQGPPPVPPRARKTGWGDDPKSAKHRSNTASIDHERFLSNNKNTKEDDIPVIPDLDEIIEDTDALDISHIPKIGVNRAAAAYKELGSDLDKNKLSSMLDGVDLSLLTEQLYAENLVQEPDEVWTWESLFTQVASEINSEWQTKANEKPQ